MTGRVRVLVDDAGDGTGLLAVPAQRVTAAEIALIVRYGSGFLYVTVTAVTAVRLDLPAMRGTADHGGAPARQRVSVDAASGVGTGISALDRARTASLLAAPTTTAADLTRPGHVVPVVVDTDRPTLAVDRAHLALGGPAVVAEVPGGAGGTGLATGDELRALAAALGLPVDSTRPRVEEPDEFLEQLRLSLLVVR